jgi:two-component sensor histidine kinase
MKYIWLYLLLWTLIVGFLYTNSISLIKKSTRKLALIEANAYFEKDKAFRFWAATHGGFYVPVSDRTKPSPYLSHIPERDIETPSGVKLTLMNPAWALRQMNEDFDKLNGFGHITSLLPLRPENSPDNWEKMALETFENGNLEVDEIIDINEQPFLRFMKPLTAEEGCLKCHAHQGSEVGDIRGGVSVSVPLTNYLDEEKKQIKSLLLSFIIIWLIGFSTIIISLRLINKKNSLLLKAKMNLEHRVKDRTKELSETNTILQNEIILRKEAEQRIEIQLKEKELILKETHHRIKNNFISIAALLSLQSDSLSNKEAIFALQDAANRVSSMALLYEKLLLKDDYLTTSTKDYLDNLIEEIIKFFPVGLSLKVVKQISDLQLDPKVLIPVGIIVNELITNIMKYAFTGRDSGIIEVALTGDRENIELIIKDNGIGLPEGFELEKQNGFGLMLIKMFTEQFTGSFLMENHIGTKSVVNLRIG